MRKVVTVRYWIEVPENEISYWKTVDEDVMSDKFIEDDVRNLVSGFSHFHDYSDILKIEIMEIQNEKSVSV